MFVGEAAMDLDTTFHTRKQGRVEVFHDNVDICEISKAMKG